MNRVAIIINDKLPPGVSANIAAILMGQLAKCCDDIYNPHLLCDKTDFIHSAISCNVIVLKTNLSKMLKLSSTIKKTNETNNIVLVIFTEEGKALNNKFDVYKKTITESSLFDLNPIGIALFGEELQIKQITKPFSLLK